MEQTVLLDVAQSLKNSGVDDGLLKSIQCDVAMDGISDRASTRWTRDGVQWLTHLADPRTPQISLGDFRSRAGCCMKLISRSAIRDRLAFTSRVNVENPARRRAADHDPAMFGQRRTDRRTIWNWRVTRRCHPAACGAVPGSCATSSAVGSSAAPAPGERSRRRRADHRQDRAGARGHQSRPGRPAR